MTAVHCAHPRHRKQPVLWAVPRELEQGLEDVCLQLGTERGKDWVPGSETYDKWARSMGDGGGQDCNNG